MSDVFISYAREDRDKAEALARVFEQQNWTVWWDKIIPPGRKYADVIGEELASAKALVVLWSRTSVASDWVKDEAQEGANRQVLVPAIIEKIGPPVGFRQVQTADLSGWDGSSSSSDLRDLVRAVGSLIQKPVSERALPAAPDRSRNRRLIPYLVIGGLLVVALSYLIYRVMNRTDRNKPGNNAPVAAASPRSTGSCEDNSRQKAAELTAKGMVMIDPGGNQAAAVLMFNEAILACANYADAYFLRGQSYVALQQNEKAVADFRKFLELTNDDADSKKAREFIASLSGPLPTPMPTQGSDNVNTVVTNTNSGPPNVDGQTAPVREMFGADKSARINATTRMIIERRRDPKAVQMSVRSALANIDNKSGVINTLVYLENVDPQILRQNRDEIERLLDAAKGNGPQTVDHIKKVQKLLGVQGL